MKLAALKGMNWKQFAIEHGEKIVLAIVGLCLLVALYKAPKKPASRKPATLVTNVSQSQAKVKSGVWPDEEKAKYGKQSGIGDMVQLLLTPVGVAGNYEYRTDMFWPLYPRQ